MPPRAAAYGATRRRVMPLICKMMLMRRLPRHAAATFYAAASFTLYDARYAKDYYARRRYALLRVAFDAARQRT